MVAEVTTCLADTSVEQALQMAHYYRELDSRHLHGDILKAYKTFLGFSVNTPRWNGEYFILVEVYISFPVPQKSVLETI